MVLHYFSSMKIILLLLLISPLALAQNSDQKLILNRFNAYVATLNNYDYLNSDYRNFTRDTVYVWHEKKEGEGMLSYYNPFSRMETMGCLYEW